MIKIYGNDTEIKKFWSQFWNEAGEEHDFIINYAYYPFTVLKKYLEKNNKILEIGCGTGRVLKGLHNEGYNIVGFDYDIGALKSINKRKNYPVFLGNVLDIPAKKETFDAVLCFGVITCIEEEKNIERSLNEIKRVLRKDGILITSFLNYNFLRQLQRLRGILKSLFRKRYFHGWADTDENLENILAKDFTLIDKVPSLSRQLFHDYIPFSRKTGNINRKLARVDDTEFKLNYLGEATFNFFEKHSPYTISGSITFVCKKP